MCTSGGVKAQVRVVAAVILILVFGVVGHSQAEKIRIFTEPLAPVHFEEHGEVRGIATEIVRAIFAEAGLDPSISPHTLTVRPVVDTADRIYDVVVRDPNEATSVVVDGRLVCRLTGNERVQVRKASATFKMIEAEGQNYYRTLREKLGWRGHMRGNV